MKTGNMSWWTSLPKMHIYVWNSSWSPEFLHMIIHRYEFFERLQNLWNTSIFRFGVILVLKIGRKVKPCLYQIWRHTLNISFFCIFFLNYWWTFKDIWWNYNVLEGEVSVSLAANNLNLTSLCLLGAVNNWFWGKTVTYFFLRHILLKKKNQWD